MTTYRKRYRASRFIHGLVGVVFVTSGLLKGWHIQGFVGNLTNLGLPIGEWGVPLAALLFWLELTLGAMLISGFRLKVARRMSQALLLAFLGFLGFLAWGGTPKPCGCFGALITLNPILMATLDAALYAMLVAIEPFPVPRNSGAYKTAFLATLALLLTASIVGSRSSWFDPLVLRLRPGFTMTSLPSLTEFSKTVDRNLVVILSEVPPSKAQLDDIQSRFADSQILIIDVNGEMDHEFHGYRIIPAKTQIVSYYVHRTPTSFRIENGTVSRVWYGRLP